MTVGRRSLRGEGGKGENPTTSPNRKQMAQDESSCVAEPNAPSSDQDGSPEHHRRRAPRRQKKETPWILRKRAPFFPNSGAQLPGHTAKLHNLSIKHQTRAAQTSPAPMASGSGNKTNSTKTQLIRGKGRGLGCVLLPGSFW